MKSKSFILLLSLGFCLVTASAQQTIESLQSEIERAEGEITRSKKLLSQNKSELNSKLGNLSLIRSNIQNRKLIISSIDKQSAILKRNISKGTSNITSLNKDLVVLKNDYRRMLVNNYKDYKQSNYLLFLFSSDSFHQMLLRGKYIERYASFGRQKSQQIVLSKSKISRTISTQKAEQLELEKKAKSRATELSALSKDEKEAQKLISELKSQEKTINADIAKQNKVIASLQSKIKEIIAAEKRKLEAQNESERKLTVQLSKTFEKNKGIFPAPVEGGVITSQLGFNTSSGLKIKNNGINITASKPSVYNIYDGVVIKVFIMQGLNSSVMVRHGNYISLYSKLSKVRVKEGDKVSSGERIGYLEAKDMNLHFELWKDMTPLNPKEWLKF